MATMAAGWYNRNFLGKNNSRRREELEKQRTGVDGLGGQTQTAAVNNDPYSGLDENAYINAYNQYQTQQSNIRDAFRKQLLSDQDYAINASNTQYDNAARQNYINYRRAQRNLPEMLNSLGIRGGASESSALRLGTNYGSNVAANESARSTANAALRQQYNNKLASYDEDYGIRLGQAYLTALENQNNYRLQIAQAREEKRRAEAELAAQQAQAANELAVQNAQWQAEYNLAKKQAKKK
jgi:hypothetical protein